MRDFPALLLHLWGGARPARAIVAPGTWTTPGALDASATLTRAQAAGAMATGDLQILYLVRPDQLAASITDTRAQAAGAMATGDVA